MGRGEIVEQVTFCTTKPGGMSMGLATGRSIVESRRGRLLAMANVPRVVAFQLTRPTERGGAA